MSQENEKVAYLLNTYPVTSATFIRNEIHALEKKGLTVKRFASRAWNQPLVESLDIEERENTQYLLDRNRVTLVTQSLRGIATNPAGFFKALPSWFSLLSNSNYSIIRITGYLVQSLILQNELRTQSIKHVHSHYSNNACSIALLTSKLSGITFSFTVHGPDEFDETNENSLSLKIKEAAFIVAISNYCKAQLIRLSSREYENKIILIRCGINLNEFKQLQYNAKNSGLKLLCVARLSPSKNQISLVRSFSGIAKSLPGSKLILVGDGEDMPAVQKEIVALEMSKNIELLGWADSQQIKTQLSECDALILPSSAEGLPIVIMEAMAAAKPVISTYIAGIPELVVNGETGWLVPAGDNVKLDSAMRELYETTKAQRKEMGQAASRLVTVMHDIENSSSQLLEQFKNVLNERDLKSVN